MTEETLQPIHSNVKSFYGKAKVTTNRFGVKYLMSYDTNVAEYNGDNMKIYGIFSMTTQRHINEFLQQNGYDKLISKQIREIVNECDCIYETYIEKHRLKNEKLKQKIDKQREIENNMLNINNWLHS